MNFFIALASILDVVSYTTILAIGLGVVLFYYAVFRRYVHSIFDPLGWVLAFSSVTVTLLFILQLQGFISTGKVAWTLVVLILFYGTFLLMEAREKRSVGRPKARASRLIRQPDSIVLASLLIINTVLWCVTYAFFGVPLFLASRLEQFAQGGGVGLLSRLTSGLDFICLMLGVLSIRTGKRPRWLGVGLVLEAVCTDLLSGSKGALVSIMFSFYLVEAYLQGRWDIHFKISARKLILVGFILLSPLAVLAAKGADNPDGVLGQLFTRIAAEGDGYVLFYGNDLIDDLAHFDPLALIRPALATFRLVPQETMVNPGYEVIAAVLDVESPLAGPNSRLPIYLYYFYGLGGIMLAPFLGAGLFAARRAVRRAFQGSPLRFSVLCSVYLLCTRLEVDPQLTVNGLVNLLLVTPILCGAVLMSGLRRGRTTRTPKPRLMP